VYCIVLYLDMYGGPTVGRGHGPWARGAAAWNRPRVAPCCIGHAFSPRRSVPLLRNWLLSLGLPVCRCVAIIFSHHPPPSLSALSVFVCARSRSCLLLCSALLYSALLGIDSPAACSCPFHAPACIRALSINKTHPPAEPSLSPSPRPARLFALPSPQP
jgi:hypothetical protein